MFILVLLKEQKKKNKGIFILFFPPYLILGFLLFSNIFFSMKKHYTT